MSNTTLDNKVTQFRQFNRFFTRQIGVLREGLLHTPYSLTEARILFELAQNSDITSTQLCRDLGLDAGYLSRILAGLEEKNLLAKVRSASDGRQRLLSLTTQGHAAFAILDQRSRDEIAEMLNELSKENQERLLKAMETITSILNNSLKYSEPFVLRQHEPGDMGWITHRHGVLYAQEYGWNEHFEALVAKIVADFITNYNPERERCWIAEVDGEIVGSVFLVQVNETDAKLRLLLVEPSTRGMGLGTRLVEECIRFARRHHYKKITLWTQSILIEARHIYQKAGFQLISQGPHHSFGHDLTEEVWELQL